MAVKIMTQKNPLIKQFDWDYVDLNLWVDNEKSEKYVDSNKIYSELLRYRNRRLLEDFGIAEMQNIFNDVSEHWRKIFETLSIEYAPLENYNMTEENTTLKKRDKIVNSIDNSTTNYTTTFDNSNFRNDTKSDDDNTTTTDYHNTLNDEKGNNNNEIEKMYNSKKGNLGVTTSQQMLNAELEIRLKDYIKKFVLAFVDEISYYD